MRSRSSSSDRKNRDEPGIALAAGAAAKLIVDAARLVALGAQDVQAAHGDHFVMLASALLGKLIVDGFPLIERNLENLAFLLEEHHGGSGRAVEFRDGFARGSGLGGAPPASACAGVSVPGGAPITADAGA